MEPSTIFVGISILKGHLNVALHPSEGAQALSNTTTSIATLVTDLEAIHPRVVTLESTGGEKIKVSGAISRRVGRAGSCSFLSLFGSSKRERTTKAT